MNYMRNQPLWRTLEGRVNINNSAPDGALTPYVEGLIDWIGVD